MTKCIICAKRTTVEVAFTCADCTTFLRNNGYTYGGESIENYKATVSIILSLNENSAFLAEIIARRQEQRQSVLDAIAMAVRV